MPPRLKCITSVARLWNMRVYCVSEIWRRRRDLNPRDPFEPNGFQDRRFQPLTHSSVFNSNVFCELAASLLPSLPLLLTSGASCCRFLTVVAGFPTATTLQT